ncbi:hypothetical protein [Aeromonas hydrophila]|uniref:hypothetical protein n=1 Tax=Aeromonas hydrophila TaxID=644 RepID=UPI002B46573C|nr:hypothetical protein [Aeromonas hydrophila]
MNSASIKRENKTYFIKPSRHIKSDENLNPIRINNNKLNGIETSIILDTNILIKMERVVKSGNKWRNVKEHGLHNLVSLLKNILPCSACISPGFALSEMPPQNAKQAHMFYEEFCSVHLPNFIDTPNCINVSYSDRIDNYGFADLSVGGKAIIAIPFAALIYIHVAERSQQKPIDKFKLFVDLLEDKIDCLSATEIEIAKYCFIEPDANAEETITLRKKIRNNFVKTRDDKIPATVDEVLKVAFNGANDIRLLHVSNSVEQTGLDGIEQDAWIATQDKKLFDFSSVFHHVNIDGEVGKYVYSNVFPELEDNYFLHAANEYVHLKIEKRINYNRTRKVSHEEIIKAAEEAIIYLRDFYRDK